MTITPSQRIEHTQAELNDRRDQLAALNSAEVFDVDVAEKLNSEIDNFERALSVMKAAETRMGLTAANHRGHQLYAAGQQSEDYFGDSRCAGHPSQAAWSAGNQWAGSVVALRGDRRGGACHAGASRSDPRESVW